MFGISARPSVRLKTLDKINLSTGTAGSEQLGAL